jgi:hypothetical protein
MGARGVSCIRAALEHDPRGSTNPPAASVAIDVDESNALAALRLDWAAAYDLGTDGNGNGIWWARRRDGLTRVTGWITTGLLAAIREDYAARPVVIR